MKILIINSSKHWGGNERWSATTANALADRGHNIHFVSRGKLFDDKLSEKITHHKLKLKHELVISDYRKLIKILHRNDVEFIIPTRRKEYWIAGIVGRLMNIPVYFRLGIVRPLSPYKFLQRFIYGALPTAILCNSKQIRLQLIKDRVIADSKIYVVYNGYSFPDYSDNIKQTGLHVFACAGRLTPQKGFDILLQAVKQLSKKRTDFLVKIAGTGPDLEQYQQYCTENKLEDFVRFDGFVNDICSYFANCDTVLISSRNEGIPNVLMEAWSVKKPVIATRSAGIPEAINHSINGILVNLEPESIAVEMETVMMNYNHYKNLGYQGFTTLQTKFALNKFLDNLESVFINSTEKGLLYEKVNL
ncbi:MAG: glycosyltransferase [Fidelibacterota bacterium]